MRAGGGFVAVHNAHGTEYNWPWYEGLLGNSNYYDHGAFQSAQMEIVSSDSSTDPIGSPGTRITFSDEWYNLVPFPTNVKFLATIDENTLATKRSTHPDSRLPPGYVCHYYDGGRPDNDARHDAGDGGSFASGKSTAGANYFRRCGVPGPPGQRHQIGNGLQPFCEAYTFTGFGGSRANAGNTVPVRFARGNQPNPGRRGGYAEASCTSGLPKDRPSPAAPRLPYDRGSRQYSSTENRTVLGGTWAAVTRLDDGTIHTAQYYSTRGAALSAASPIRHAHAATFPHRRCDGCLFWRCTCGSAETDTGIRAFAWSNAADGDGDAQRAIQELRSRALHLPWNVG